jgi:hypothetical protein
MKMKQMIEQHGKDLLNIRYILQVNLRRKINQDIDKQKFVPNYRRNKGYDDVATLEVTPLHLAILSRQESSLETIMEEVITSFTKQNADLGMNKDHILGTKVSVKFPTNDNFKDVYSEEDCMLDGMNLFHLSTKYFPEGLETIIRYLRRQNGLFLQVNDLVAEKDHQIENTPLHVAADCGSIVAMRYVISVLIKI